MAVIETDNRTGVLRRGDRALLLATRFALPLTLVLAVVVRVFLIVRAPGVLDGDEALVGIQAERIAAGTAHPLPVFFPGQPYMGALEAYLAAGVFHLVGPSVPALRMVPLTFALLLVALTYELTRRIMGRQAAAFAALVAALPPLYVGIWSLKARGGYVETLAFGSALLIVTHRLLYGPGEALGLLEPSRSRPWRTYGWWLLWGALAGLLFWINPISVYYILTAAGALIIAALRRHRWRPRRADLRAAALPAGLGLVGVAVGGFPLWVANVSSRGATFGYLLRGSGGGPLISRTPRVAAHFLADVVPRLTGAWEPWAAPASRPLGAAVLALYALGGLYLLVRLLAGRRDVLGYRARPRHGQGLALAFAAVVAALFCLSGFGANALNPFGFDASTRYALPLASVLPVVVGALIWRVWHAWPPLGAAALALLLLTSAAGYTLAQPSALFQSEYWGKLPASEAPLTGFLEQNGIRDVWMNHWAGYPLMFYANGRITAADYNDVVLNHGVNRLPWALARVSADPHAAYVLVTDERRPPLERLLAARGARFTSARVGPYLVLWNLHPTISPGQVTEGIGFDY